MTKQEKILQLKEEVQETIKRWAAIANEESIQIVSGISILDSEDQGIHFMQSISASASTVAQNLIANIERTPLQIKANYSLAIIAALTEVDEEVEHAYKK